MKHFISLSFYSLYKNLPSKQHSNITHRAFGPKPKGRNFESNGWSRVPNSAGPLNNWRKWYGSQPKPHNQITACSSEFWLFLMLSSGRDWEWWKPNITLFCFPRDPRNSFLPNLNKKAWSREWHMLCILTSCKFTSCLIKKGYKNLGPFSWKTIIYNSLVSFVRGKDNLLYCICQGVSHWHIPESWLGLLKYLMLYHSQWWWQGT